MLRINNIKNQISIRFQLLVVKYCIFLRKNWQIPFLRLFDWILVSYFEFMPFRKKTFPEKMGNVCFCSLIVIHIFVWKNMCLCNFPKLLYCVEGFFEAWNLFLNVFYLQSLRILEIIIDNIRRNFFKKHAIWQNCSSWI